MFLALGLFQFLLVHKAPPILDMNRFCTFIQDSIVSVETSGFCLLSALTNGDWMQVNCGLIC